LVDGGGSRSGSKMDFRKIVHEKARHTVTTFVTVWIRTDSLVKFGPTVGRRMHPNRVKSTSRLAGTPRRERLSHAAVLRRSRRERVNGRAAPAPPRADLWRAPSLAPLRRSKALVQNLMTACNSTPDRMTGTRLFGYDRSFVGVNNRILPASRGSPGMSQKNTGQEQPGRHQRA
jgi:hypothetical protein